MHMRMHMLHICMPTAVRCLHAATRAKNVPSLITGLAPLSEAVARAVRAPTRAWTTGRKTTVVVVEAEQRGDTMSHSAPLTDTSGPVSLT